MLVRASSIEDAQQLFRDFDVVPSPARGPIRGYFEKSSRAHHELRPELLISADTPLLELPGLLSARPFYFVNRMNRVVGYVHYSDLNRPPARAPFFALLEAAETSLSRAIDGVISDSDVHAISSPAEFRGLQHRLRQRRAQNLDLGWLAVLSFGQILRISRRHGVIHLDDNDLRLLKEFRNRIAHTNLRLIEANADIRRLSRAKTILQSIAKSA
jgi:hypothetical protein